MRWTPLFGQPKGPNKVFLGPAVRDNFSHFGAQKPFFEATQKKESYRQFWEEFKRLTFLAGRLIVD